MIFEFTTAPGFDFITFFAKQINAIVRDNYLEIPNTIGEGYTSELNMRK